MELCWVEVILTTNTKSSIYYSTNLSYVNQQLEVKDSD